MDKPAGQEIQEQQYDVPYHWFFSDEEYRGRKYFGYIRSAIQAAQQSGIDITTARILDAGCGDGRMIRELYEHGATEVSGLDYSEAALRFARAFLPNTTLYVGDFTEATSLQEAGQFDTIFLIETLEHIPVKDVDTVVKNLQTMLKPGGVLVITVPSTGLPLHKKHYQHFTEETLRVAVENHFHVEHVAGYRNIRKWLFLTLYKLFDNRWWYIKPAARFYNRVLYPRHLNQCAPDAGEGLLMVLRSHE